jgi:hypothetical protein
VTETDKVNLFALLGKLGYEEGKEELKKIQNKVKE